MTSKRSSLWCFSRKVFISKANNEDTYVEVKEKVSVTYDLPSITVPVCCLKDRRTITE